MTVKMTHLTNNPPHVIRIVLIFSQQEPLNPSVLPPRLAMAVEAAGSRVVAKHRRFTLPS